MKERKAETLELGTEPCEELEELRARAEQLAARIREEHPEYDWDEIDKAIELLLNKATLRDDEGIPTVSIDMSGMSDEHYAELKDRLMSAEGITVSVVKRGGE